MSFQKDAGIPILCTHTTAVGVLPSTRARLLANTDCERVVKPGNVLIVVEEYQMLLTLFNSASRLSTVYGPA